MPTKEQVALDIFNTETSEIIGRLENVTNVLVNSNSEDEYKNDPHGEWFLKNHWTATCEISLEEILKDGYLAKIYNEAIKYLENGFYILDKEIDYSDSTYKNALRNLAENNEDMIVILGED